jgi:sporulation integral membrane protein YtvI
MSPFFKKILTLAAIFAGLWLAVRYVLPVALPFLLGAGLALAAEPLVKRLTGRLPRAVAAGVGVTAALLGVVAIGTLAGAVILKEMRRLAAALPDLQVAAQKGILQAQDYLVGLAEQTPESLRPFLQQTALSLFDGSTTLVRQVTGRLPAAVGAAVGWVGDGALTVGTGLLSAFLISARLPKLKAAAQSRLPQSWRATYLPALRRVRSALGGWLKAQGKLCLVTWGIVTVGFFLLRIPYAPAWAALIAVVDAVPILGTGTVLVPWAVVCLLRRQSLQAVGLLLIYGAAMITRTALEPRLVGRQLGLDPLATLAALYLGYRFWGIAGMLVTPILASAASSLTSNNEC